MPDIRGDRDEREELEDDGPFANFDPGPVPVAADGGIQPGYGVGPPEPVPEMDADHCICVRGPCRYFWEMVVPMEAGNPKGTWDSLGIEAPKQFLYTCTHGPEETPLNDTVVFECNRWDPMDQSMFREREYRRKKWLEENELVEVIEDDETLAE